MKMMKQEIDKKCVKEEFINYLEENIKKERDVANKLCEIYNVSKENNATYRFIFCYIDKLEEILQKYKELNEVSDE